MKKRKPFNFLLFLPPSLIFLFTCAQNQEDYHPHTTAPVIPSAMADSSKVFYPWLNHYDPKQSLLFRMGEPEGFKRIPAAPGSFSEWLRMVPIKAGKPEVLLFNGEKKYNQDAHALVVNMDVGTKDLQQCADAIMRLRAEYLFSTGKFDAIHFNFTSGHISKYSEWKKGMRPVVNGNNVTWKMSATADNSYAGFKKYMEMIFNWCGTASLFKEMISVPDKNEIHAGDIFIHGGSPGHAVMVMDIAVNNEGKKVFMLAQSYMPAQEMHILKNPSDAALSPWYPADFSWPLETPEWTFEEGTLKRFR